MSGLILWLHSPGYCNLSVARILSHWRTKGWSEGLGWCTVTSTSGWARLKHSPLQGQNTGIRLAAHSWVQMAPCLYLLLCSPTGGLKVTDLPWGWGAGSWASDCPLHDPYMQIHPSILPRTTSSRKQTQFILCGWSTQSYKLPLSSAPFAECCFLGSFIF